MEENIASNAPSKFKLPKSFTTVTTFSKILALFLFITLPFLGFYLGMKYKEGTQLGEKITNDILTPTPTSTPINDATNWKIYTSSEYGISFKYPENWGDVIVKNEKIDYSNVLNDESEQNLKESLPKAIKQQINFTFKGFENKSPWRNVSMFIYKYDQNNYLILDCYEGECNYRDILQEKNKILEKSNINIAGNKGYIHDSYFTPGANYERLYSFASNDKYFVVNSGFSTYNVSADIKDIPVPTEILHGAPDNYKNIFLEDIISTSPSNNSTVEMKNFLIELSGFINSIKYL